MCQNQFEAADLKIEKIALEQLCRIGVWAFHEQESPCPKADSPKLLVRELRRDREGQLGAGHNLELDPRSIDLGIEQRRALFDLCKVVREILPHVRRRHDRGEPVRTG